MILHTVNRSPHAHTALQQCLAVIAPPAALLLIEDGVYAATTACQSLLAELPAGVELYALSPDLAARGLAGALNPRIGCLDDGGFVDLSVRCSKMVAWY